MQTSYAPGKMNNTNSNNARHATFQGSGQGKMAPPSPTAPLGHMTAATMPIQFIDKPIDQQIKTITLQED